MPTNRFVERSSQQIDELSSAAVNIKGLDLSIDAKMEWSVQDKRKGSSSGRLEEIE